MSRFYLFRHIVRDGRLRWSRRSLPPPVSGPEVKERQHAAFDWILRSIDAVHGQGSSKGYSYVRGWLPAYPETSGYIISSLLRYGETFAAPQAMEKAKGIARWLGGVINADGGISAIGATASPSLAFDTGMVLQGLTDLAQTTGESCWAELAHRCADFLVARQQDDGSWSQDYSSIPHAYHARIAWPLLRYGIVFDRPRARSAAEASLSWVLKQQRENGTFAQAFFSPRLPYVNTHSLGYIVEGLLESYLLTRTEEWRAAAERTADRLAGILFRNRGFLPGFFREDWQEKRLFPVSFACLTGMAQLSRCWFLLYRMTGDARHLEAGNLSLSHVVRYQDIETGQPAVRGALPGSGPFFGRYLPLQFPNWAAKFLLDALMEKSRA